jgi:RNA 3'-terminal phosphate cyclase (ATP)
MKGADLHSTQLEFRPGSRPKGGSYRFDVSEASPSGRSAGSVTLILQAMLWPMLFANQPSEIILRGGTFVPFSPPFHYTSEVAQPAFGRFGADMETCLNAWGWMNEGSGEMAVSIKPVDRLVGVNFQPTSEPKVDGIAAVTNLPSHIPHRMARRAHNMLTSAGLEVDVQSVRAKGAGPGAGIVLWMEQGGFSSLGRKGLPADKVAQAAVADLRAFAESGAAVDYHLADQLLLPMALAHGRSSFTTDRLTNHTLTNISLLRKWLETRVEIKGGLDEAGMVSVEGVGHRGD